MFKKPNSYADHRATGDILKVLDHLFPVHIPDAAQLEVAKEIVLQEPLINWEEGGWIRAVYNNDPQATNNRKAVHAALERVKQALRAQHFYFRNSSGAYDPRSSGGGESSYQVVQKDE